MEIAKIAKAFEWIKRLFYQTQFKGDRLKILANKMSTDVNQLKRKGSRMSKVLMRDLLYDEGKTFGNGIFTAQWFITCYTIGSNARLTSMIRQQIFLKDLATTVAKSENKSRKILENIRDLILKPQNVTVHVATSLEKLRSSYAEIMDDGVLPPQWTEIFSYPGKEPVKR